MVFESVRIVSCEREEKIGSGHQVSYVPMSLLKWESFVWKIFTPASLHFY